MFFCKVYPQPIVQNAVLLYGTACTTAEGPLESKLNHLVRIICGCRKRNSIRAARKLYCVLTVKELHLKEILMFLVVVLRNESPLEEIKPIITCVELEKV